MVYLIGLNHRYQLEGYEDDWKSFYEFLSNKAKEIDADLLAEEMSEEGLALYNVNNSVVRRVAAEQDRQHLFIDPDSIVKKRLGIKGFKEIADELGFGSSLRTEETEQVEKIEKLHWNKREMYWFEQLRKVDFKRCLCIIGASHIEGFIGLLLKEQIEHIVLTARYIP